MSKQYLNPHTGSTRPDPGKAHFAKGPRPLSAFPSSRFYEYEQMPRRWFGAKSCIDALKKSVHKRDPIFHRDDNKDQTAK